MYNDSWPVTHGWTIVDYYLRKKLAYHPVRRAFAPVTVVVAEEAGQVMVLGVNDTPEDWRGEVRFGVFSFAGEYLQDTSRTVTLPANASTPLACIDRMAWVEAGYEHAAAFALLSHGGERVAQHRLFLARFKDLALHPPAITVRRTGDRVCLRAGVFVWQVCLDIDGEAPVPDNAFDLFPGMPYELAWPADAPEPAVRYVGSQLVLKA
jgi:beta-mannosidase